MVFVFGAHTLGGMYGIALSASGTFALVTDTNYNNVRHIDVRTQAVTVLAGIKTTSLRHQDPGGWIHVFSRSAIEIQTNFH